MKVSTKIVAALTLGFWLTGCMPAEFAMYKDENDGGNKGLGTTNPPVVCDPFDTGNIVSPTSGLKGSIHYLTAAQPRYSKSTDIINNGTKVNVDLFLNTVNVPTRIFDTGFTPDGAPALEDENHNRLIEWFALNLKSKIKLGPSDTAGEYQLAIISDDGATLSLQDATSGIFNPHIVSEGDHSTKMACATTRVTMDATSRIPMNLSYYQGPRTHIALMLMWRKVSPTESLNDAGCGKEGNDYFFQSATATSAAIPKTPYQQLLSRGWKPLSGSNFELQSGKNLCSGATI